MDEYDDALIMASVKHRAWVNVYKGHIGDTFDTEEEAIKYGKKCSTYITTVLVEWKNSHSGEYDKKHIFNNKVFHRRIKHVRT